MRGSGMLDSEKYLQLFISKLKKFSTREVAKMFSQFNRFYYDHYVERPITREFSDGYRKYDLIVLPWLFNRIIFASTSYNDFRADITEEQAWDLYLLYHKYFNAVDSEYADMNYSDPSHNILTPILYGHLQEQSIYQVSMRLYINRFNRSYSILKNEIFDGIDLQRIIHDKFQIDMDAYVKTLCLIAILSVHHKIINSDKILQLIEDKDLFLQIADDCSVSYQKCRSYKSKIDIFRIHPILKTSYNEYIVPDINTLFFNFGDKLYWILKDYFHKSSTFVNQFGTVFENYVYEILSKQYGKEHVQRIEIVKGEKSADIIINGSKYAFLIEIKSGVAGGDAKLQNLNQNTLDFYIQNNIVDAMEQLDASAKKLGNGKEIICFILNYDLSFTEDSLLLDIEQKYRPQNYDVKKLLYFGIDYFENLIYQYNNLNKLEKLFDSYSDKELSVHSLTEGCDSPMDYFYEDVFNKNIDEFVKNNKPED